MGRCFCVGVVQWKASLLHTLELRRIRPAIVLQQNLHPAVLVNLGTNINKENVFTNLGTTARGQGSCVAANNRPWHVLAAPGMWRRTIG
jgi:hypothetical protein